MINPDTDAQNGHDNLSPRQKVPAARLAWIALYIGIAGYGGGPAIIGMMRQLFVDKLGWVSEEDFFTGLSLCQILPGANAVSLIEFIGYTVRGALGALIAPICFLTPAFILMTVLSGVYFSLRPGAAGEGAFHRAGRGGGGLARECAAYPG